MNLKDFYRAFKIGLMLWVASIILFDLFSKLIDRFLKIPLSMVIIFSVSALLIGLIVGIKFFTLKPILLAISVQAVISVLFGAFLFVLTKKEEFETIFQCSPFELLYNYIFHVLLWIGFSALGSFIGKSIKSRNRKLQIKN
ncbi:MAG: hypothetical protein QXP04_03830 [Candidatus Nanoarchaeia archaeon]|nr:hypothetical protein [Candidatus Jingweiarchaeum tengchongense]